MKLKIPKVVKGIQHLDEIMSKDTQNTTNSLDKSIINKNNSVKIKSNTSMKFIYKEFYNWLLRKRIHNNSKYLNKVANTSTSIYGKDLSYIKIDGRNNSTDVNKIIKEMEYLNKVFRDSPQELLRKDLVELNKRLDELGGPAELYLEKEASPVDIFLTNMYILYNELPSENLQAIKESHSIFKDMQETAKNNSINEKTEYKSIYTPIHHKRLLLLGMNGVGYYTSLNQNSAYVNSIYYLSKRNKESHGIMTPSGRSLFAKLYLPKTMYAFSTVDNIYRDNVVIDKDNLMDSTNNGLSIAIRGCSLTNKWGTSSLEPRDEALYITGNKYSYPNKLVAAAYLYIDSLEDLLHNILNDNISLKSNDPDLFIKNNAQGQVLSLLSRFSILNTHISIFGEGYDDASYVDKPLTLSSRFKYNTDTYPTDITKSIHAYSTFNRMFSSNNSSDADYKAHSMGFVIPPYAHRELRGGYDTRECFRTDYVTSDALGGDTYPHDNYSLYVDPFRTNERLYVEPEYGLTSAVALFEVAANMYGVENLLKYISKLCGLIDFISTSLSANIDLPPYIVAKSLGHTDPNIEEILVNYKIATKYASKRGVAIPKTFLRNTLEDALFIYYHSILTFMNIYRKLSDEQVSSVKEQLFTSSTLDSLILDTDNNASAKYMDILNNNTESICCRLTEDSNLYNVVWDKYISKYNKVDSTALKMIPHTLFGTKYKYAQHSLLDKQHKLNINRRTLHAADINNYQKELPLRDSDLGKYLAWCRPPKGSYRSHVNLIQNKLYSSISAIGNDTYTIKLFLQKWARLAGNVTTTDAIDKHIWTSPLVQSPKKVYISAPISSHMNVNIINPPNKVGTSLNKMMLDYKIIAPLQNASILSLRNNTPIGEQREGLFNMEQALDATLNAKLPLFPDIITNVYNVPLIVKYLNMHGVGMYDYIMDYKYIPSIYTDTIPFSLNTDVSSEGLGYRYTGWNSDRATQALNKVKSTPAYANIDDNLYKDFLHMLNIRTHLFDYIHSWWGTSYIGLNGVGGTLLTQNCTPTSYINNNFILPVHNPTYIGRAKSFTGNSLNSIYLRFQLMRTLNYQPINNITDYKAYTELEQQYIAAIFRYDNSIIPQGAYRTNVTNVFTQDTFPIYLHNNYMNFWVNAMHPNPLINSYSNNIDASFYTNSIKPQFVLGKTININIYSGFRATKPSVSDNNDVQIGCIPGASGAEYLGSDVSIDVRNRSQLVHPYVKRYMQDYNIGTYDPIVMGIGATFKERHPIYYNVKQGEACKLATYISDKHIVDILSVGGRRKDTLAQIKEETKGLLDKVNKGIINLTKIFGLDIHPIYAPQTNNIKRPAYTVFNKTYISDQHHIGDIHKDIAFNTYAITLTSRTAVAPHFTELEGIYSAPKELKPSNVDLPILAKVSDYLCELGVNTSYTFTDDKYIPYIDFLQSNLETTYGFLNSKYSMYSEGIDINKMSKGITFTSGEKALDYINLLQELVGDNAPLGKQVVEHTLHNKGVIEGLFVAAANTLKESHTPQQFNVVGTDGLYFRDRGLVSDTGDTPNAVPSLIVKDVLGTDLSMLQNPETTTIGVSPETFTRSEKIRDMIGVHRYADNLKDLVNVVLKRYSKTLDKLKEPDVCTPEVLAIYKNFHKLVKKGVIDGENDVLILGSWLLSAELLINLYNSFIYKKENNIKDLTLDIEMFNKYVQMHIKESWLNLEAIPSYRDFGVGNIDKLSMGGLNAALFPRIYQLKNKEESTNKHSDMINARFSNVQFHDVYKELNNILQGVDKLSASLNNKFNLQTYLKYFLSIYISMIKIGGYSVGGDHIDGTLLAQDIPNIIFNNNTSVGAINLRQSTYITPNLHNHFILLNMYGIYNLKGIMLDSIMSVIQPEEFDMATGYTHDYKSILVEFNHALLRADIGDLLIKLASKYMRLRFRNGDDFIDAPYIPTDALIGMHRYLTLIDEHGEEADLNQVVKYIMKDLQKATIVTRVIKENVPNSAINSNNIVKEEYVKDIPICNNYVTKIYTDNTYIKGEDRLIDRTYITYSLGSAKSFLGKLFASAGFINILRYKTQAVANGYRNDGAPIAEYFSDHKDEIALNNMVTYPMDEVYPYYEISAPLFTHDELDGIWAGSAYNKVERDIVDKLDWPIHRTPISNLIKRNMIHALYESHNIDEDMIEANVIANHWVNLLVLDSITPKDDSINYKTIYPYVIGNEEEVKYYISPTPITTDISGEDRKNLINDIRNEGSSFIRMIYIRRLLHNHATMINNMNWVLNSAIQAGDFKDTLNKYKSINKVTSFINTKDVSNDTLNDNFVPSVVNSVAYLEEAPKIWLKLLTDNMATTSFSRYNEVSVGDLYALGGWLPLWEGPLLKSSLFPNMDSFIKQNPLNNALVNMGCGTQDRYDSHNIHPNLLNKYTGWKLRPSLVDDATSHYRIVELDNLFEAVVAYKKCHTNLRENNTSPKDEKIVKKVGRTKLYPNSIMPSDEFCKSINIPDWLVHIKSKDFSTNLGKAYTPLIYKIMNYIEGSMVLHPLNLPGRFFKEFSQSFDLLPGKPAYTTVEAKKDAGELYYRAHCVEHGLYRGESNTHPSPHLAESIGLRGYRTYLKEPIHTNGLDRNYISEVSSIIGYTNDIIYNNFYNIKDIPILLNNPSVFDSIHKYNNSIDYMSFTPRNIQGYTCDSTNNRMNSVGRKKLVANTLKNYIKNVVDELVCNNTKFDTFIETVSGALTSDEISSLSVYNWIYTIGGFYALVYTGIIDEYLAHIHVMHPNDPYANVSELNKLLTGLSNFIQFNKTPQNKDGEVSFSINIKLPNNISDNDRAILTEITEESILCVKLEEGRNTLHNKLFNIFNNVFSALSTETLLTDMSESMFNKFEEIYSRVQNIVENKADTVDVFNSVLYKHSLYPSVNFTKFIHTNKDLLIKQHNSWGIVNVPVFSILKNNIEERFKSIGLPVNGFNLLYVYDNIHQKLYIALVWFGMYLNTPSIYVTFNEDLISIVLSSIIKDDLRKLCNVPIIREILPFKDNTQNPLVNKIFKNPGALVEHIGIQPITPEYSYHNLKDRFRDEITDKVSKLGSIQALDIPSLVTKYSTLCTPIDWLVDSYMNKRVSSIGFVQDSITSAIGRGMTVDKVAQYLDKLFPLLYKQLEYSSYSHPLKMSLKGRLHLFEQGIQMLPPMFKEGANYSSTYNNNEFTTHCLIKSKAICDTYVPTPAVRLKDTGIQVNTFSIFNKLRALLFPEKPLVYVGNMRFEDIINGNYSVGEGINHSEEVHVYTIGRSFHNLINCVDAYTYKEDKEESRTKVNNYLPHKEVTRSFSNLEKTFNTAIKYNILEGIYNINIWSSITGDSVDIPGLNIRVHNPLYNVFNELRSLHSSLKSRRLDGICWESVPKNVANTVSLAVPSLDQIIHTVIFDKEGKYKFIRQLMKGGLLHKDTPMYNDHLGEARVHALVLELLEQYKVYLHWEYKGRTDHFNIGQYNALIHAIYTLHSSKDDIIINILTGNI